MNPTTLAILAGIGLGGIVAILAAGVGAILGELLWRHNQRRKAGLE